MGNMKFDTKKKQKLNSHVLSDALQELITYPEPEKAAPREESLQSGGIASFVQDLLPSLKSSARSARACSSRALPGVNTFTRGLRV